MKVSVIVVSYNACALLRRSLRALTKATENLDSEILLVDTGSADHTIEMVMKEFPRVRITTSVNTKSCTKAINHGISMAKGELVLLVKPDVIVHKDAVSRSINFMESHALSGGLGVRMLDGDGNYLPSSKKVLPKTWVTFFKYTGLLKQFPKSRLTENTHIHHEEEFDTTETDVLAGNFMLLKRAVLKEVGLLDERFASYGGNIDLSYRMRLAGYKNYYFPKTYVIDLQANKVNKFSWQHLKSFYGAMFIFAIKYFFSLPALYVKPVQEMYPAYGLKG